MADQKKDISETSTPERDYISLSALQHYLFCPRQCALIHVEQLWQENLYTAEGRLMHERNTEPGHEIRRGVMTVMAMPLVSHKLAVSGISDVVELHGETKQRRPYPVEYKRGKPKAHRADEVQLCAQAICLEEMFHCEIGEGALFYGKNKRRKTIDIDDELRDLTTQTAFEIHDLIRDGKTPGPNYEKRKCDACSLNSICRPKQIEKHRSVKGWVLRSISEEVQ